MNHQILSRREALLSMLATLAVGTFARGQAAPAACTFGFGTYGMKTLTTEEAIIAVAKIGYDSILIATMPGWESAPQKLTPQRRTDLRKLLKDVGLLTPAILGDFHPAADDKAHAVQLESIRQTAQLGHDLSPNNPLIVQTMLGGSGTWESVRPMFAKRLADWVKLADELDFTFAIKAHRGTAMSKLDEVIELFHDLGDSPRVRLCYDYSHFAFRDMPMPDTIKTALPWTSVITVKDTAIVNGKAVFRLPGETGAIDYAAMFRQFSEGGFVGDINCEISTMIWSKPGYDPLVAAKKCYENLAPAFVAAKLARKHL